MVDVDILENVKVGDSLTTNEYPELGIKDGFQQNPRVVTGITTTDSVSTNTYIEVGITTNVALYRDLSPGENKLRM